MKQLLIILGLFLISTLNAQELSVMTYNIKLDYPKEGENSWTKRQAFMVDQIKFYEPDILGVQEAMPNQMIDLYSLLTSYSFVGVGRDDGKNKGEFSAIFYKKADYKVIEQSTFWLSETPEKVSMGWDAVCNRVCTYALFKNKNTKQKFWVFNTHFDHVGKLARYNSSKLIIQKINSLNTKKYPVVLMGDFNLEANSESIQYILNYLHDSKSLATNTLGPSGTFNGFKFHEPVTRRIDYIFMSPEIKVNKYAVLSDSKDCKYASDHLPVLALFEIFN